ncbi:Cytochrome c, mono-and diheme variants [Thalassovita gelatinovora]|uniref:Cytochrome c, mono-and diheme variants n=1 Tax=Thalassovita gelatinovora TaxID=53501 RepID=A0A0P1FS89_THAGE|nr:cytochrome c [Thalassovita gelatinovora]QIZ80206.1 cytochrome c [Thalassovita gelatinovora]CUH64047.1 Cytochrome c, mono-and diheme variants [Thalassovita gelatinovora]SEQ82271.1 Cytochrome C oxidase, cbb3-type, subunit III [Thalassovita gelatinovora]
MKRLIAVLFLAACSDAPDPAGQDLFNAYCVMCHGPAGQGDGGLAGDLDIPPADLSLLADRNGGVFPRDLVMETVYGYPGKFHMAAMPEFGPLLTGPTRMVRSQSGALIETPEALIELTDYVENLQQR